MIGTVTFDGLSQGQLWIDLTGDAAIDAPRLVATLGLALGVALVGGFYTLGIAGARSVGRQPERPAAAARPSSTRWCRSRWSTWPPTTSPS